VSLLEQQYRAIGEGRFATTFYDSLAEDVELEILGPPDCPFLGRWTGRDQVYAAVERNFGLIETQLPLIESVVAQGDTVVVIGRETGRYREPAAEYRVAWVQVMTFAGGRIQRLQEFVTPVLD
jgi:ketosteroid isomerase-like protein